MAEPLTVLQAVTALRLHNDTHADVFEKCHAQLPDASPILADYLRLIKDEPDEWLRSLPKNWKCQSYFLKARAALNAMASLHAVVTAMEREDADLLPSLRNTVRRRLMSKDLDAVIKERRGGVSVRSEGSVAASEAGAGSDSGAESDGTEGPNPVSIVGPPVERLRDACLAYAEATDRHAIAAIMRSLWGTGPFEYELPGEKEVLMELVPAMEDGASVADVYRAITTGR